MNKHNAVGVKDVEGDRVTICARGDNGANYDTLCGNSLSDSDLVEVPIKPNARITCDICKATWRLARSFKASDFAD